MDHPSGASGTVSPATPADAPSAQRVPTSAHFSLTVPAHIQSASERLVLALEIPETGARAFSVRDAAAVTGLSVETAGYRLRTLIDGYIGVVHDWSPRSARVLATRDDECAPLAVLAPLGFAGPSKRGRVGLTNLGTLWSPWLLSMRVLMWMFREVAADLPPAHPAFSPDALTAAGWVCLALARTGEPIPARLATVAATPVIHELAVLDDLADMTSALDDLAEAGGHTQSRAALIEQLMADRTAWRREHGSPGRHPDPEPEPDHDDSQSASGSCVEFSSPSDGTTSDHVFPWIDDGSDVWSGYGSPDSPPTWDMPDSSPPRRWRAHRFATDTSPRYEPFKSIILPVILAVAAVLAAACGVQVCLASVAIPCSRWANGPRTVEVLPRARSPPYAP